MIDDPTGSPVSTPVVFNQIRPTRLRLTARYKPGPACPPVCLVCFTELPEGKEVYCSKKHRITARKRRERSGGQANLTPDHRQAFMRVVELVDQGFSIRAAVAKASPDALLNYRTASRWLVNMGKYDPFPDPVVYERFRRGDYAVLEHATVWEKRDLEAELSAKAGA